MVGNASFLFLHELRESVSILLGDGTMRDIAL